MALFSIHNEGITSLLFIQNDKNIILIDYEKLI